MLNVNRLRMLREIATRGGVAAAAAALYMSPSAVSQQMAVLEREAGVPLLEKAGRGVRLTEAGRRLVENTERVLADIELAEADLAAASVGLVARVRMAAHATSARALLLPAIKRLEAEYPNLVASMVEMEPEESIPALKSEELDLAITYGWNFLPELDDPGLDRQELLVEPVYVALRKGHRLAGRKVSMGDLRDEEWILWHGAASFQDLVYLAARRAGFEPRTDFRARDVTVVLSAVEAGLGVSIVPSLALLYPHADIVVTEVSDLELSRTISATVRKGSRDTPGIAAALDQLQDVASRVPAPF